MLARQLAYITYVRGSMSTLQILLFLYFYGFMPPTLSREEPEMIMKAIYTEKAPAAVEPYSQAVVANYGKRSLLTKIKHPVVEILRLFKQPMSESVVHIQGAPGDSLL